MKQKYILDKAKSNILSCQLLVEAVTAYVTWHFTITLKYVRSFQHSTGDLYKGAEWIRHVGINLSGIRDIYVDWNWNILKQENDFSWPRKE